MRNIALLLLLLISAVASAQGFDAKEMLVTKRIFVALRSEVKAELKLTPEQETKMKAAFGNALREEGGHLILSMGADTDLVVIDKEARKVLTKEQTKRLDELWIQNLAGNALADDEVAKSLKLTPDQQKAIATLVDDAGRQLGELMFSGDLSSAEKTKEITVKAGQKMLALLNADQAKAYAELKGKEFKFKDPK